MRNFRNAGLVIGLGLIVLIAAAFALTTWALARQVQAERQAALAARAEAELARDRAEATNVFVEQMLARSVAPGPDSAQTVREVLEAAAAGVDERFADQPLVAGRLHLTIGQAHLRAGAHADAEASLLAAYGVLSSVRAADDAEVVAAVRSLVELYDGWDDVDPAADHGDRAAEWRSKLPPEGPAGA